MGIDKLNITIDETVDRDFLSVFWCIDEDEFRTKHYKYFCKMDYAEVMWKYHKFGEETNKKYPYCKVDINPKYFGSFKEMCTYLFAIFGKDTMDLSRFNITRIDLMADIDNLKMDVVRSRLFATRCRPQSITTLKGSTIYIGSNPKIRIYDKNREIKDRVKKSIRKNYGQMPELTDYEQGILDTDRQVTRFEIQLRNVKMSLKELKNDPIALISNFDRLKFFNFGADTQIDGLGGLQHLMSKVRREYRKELEQYKDDELETMIKDKFIEGIREWFELDQTN